MTTADPALREAIAWMARLRSGEAGAAERRRFEAWLAADARHSEAWGTVTGALDRAMQPLRERRAAAPRQLDALRETLLRSPPRRRLLRGALVVAGLGVGGGLLIDRRHPLAGLAADLASATGERRTFALPDGSSATLNARSAADLAFGGGQRTLRLREGELLVTARPGPAPLVVESGAACVQAPAGRFLVRREASRTLVAVLEGAVTLQPAGGPGRLLQHGGCAYVDAGRVADSPGDPAALAAWNDGLLEVQDQPLGQVVEALRAYRSGFIRIAPAAARLRVLGVYPLDDSDRALDLLAATLPIRLDRYGGWLVSIDLAGKAARNA